jgi:putative ABC transport system permease protein
MNRSQQLAHAKSGSLFARIWLRSLTVKRSQAFLALAALAAGAAAGSLLLNLNAGVEEKMTQDFRAFGPNVILTARQAQRGDGRQPATLPAPSPEGVAAAALGVGAKDSVPLLYAVVQLKPAVDDPLLPQFENAVAAGGDFALLLGLNPNWRVDGVRALADDECAVGALVAERFNLIVGSSLRLDTPQNSGGATEHTLRVVAVVRSGSQEDGQVFTGLAALQAWTGLEGQVSAIELRLPGSPAQVERSAQRLAAVFPAARVTPVRQIVERQGNVLKTVSSLLAWLAILIVAIVSLCVMATMTAIILERRKDVAVMKALGAGESLILRLFLSEGAALGLAGGLAGFALGAWAAHEAALRLFQVSVGVAWWSLPLVALCTAALAAAATSFPVQLTRRIQAAAILKGE